MMSPVKLSGTTIDELHDRLEERDARLLGALLQRERARDLERHVRRVDGVELAVDERDLDVDHRVPAEDPLGHRLHDPLLDRGDELVRDRRRRRSCPRRRTRRRAGAARSRCCRPRTGRGRPSASRGGPTAATLPLDRLAVRDLRRVVLHLDAELRLEPAHLDVRGAPRPCRRSRSRASPRCGRRGTTGPPRAGARARSRACPRRPSSSARSRTRGAARAGPSRGSVTGSSFVDHVSPVCACWSLATAPMSPAAHLGDRHVLLARPG